MSTRGYLSKNPCQTTQEENTPVCIKLQASHATVKAVQARLQDAYRRDDVRVVRRSSVLLERLTPTAAVTVRCARWGVSPSCLDDWQKAFRWRGMDSLVSRHRGGRPEQVTPRQNKRLVELLAAGPMVVGCETACGTSGLLRGLIWRALGVLCKRHSGCTVLHHRGVSCQQARVVAEHLDAAKRLAWLQDQWPAIGRAAKRCQGMLLLAEEARCAQGGSCSDTGARRGQHPAVPTSGKRQGSKVGGALDSCSGRLFFQGSAGRLNSASAQAFVQLLLAHTTEHLFVSHAGARSHPSASPHTFLAAPHDRLTAPPFPAYSPDDHPREYLWQKTTQRATHPKYFKEFAALTIAVEKALAYCVMPPAEV
jgi:transposase